MFLDVFMSVRLCPKFCILNVGFLDPPLHCNNFAAKTVCPLKSLLRVSEHPQQCHMWMLAMLAFPLVFTPGIMSVFYVDIIKQHETNLSAEKSNIYYLVSLGI